MKTFWVVLSVLALVVSSFFTGRLTRPCPPYEVRIDTLVVRDTIRDTIPVEVVRYVTRTVRDTTLIVTRDTVTNQTYVEVPIEEIRYKTDAYDLWIEGYRARLLNIEVYKDTYHIDRVKTHKASPRRGFGLQAGYGVTFNGKFHPYIGFGVQYNFITW